MRRTTSLVLMIGLALGGGAALLARGAGAGPGDPVSGRVAVVDVISLLNAAPRKRAIEQAKREGRAAVETYVQDQRNKLRDMMGEIEKLTQFDPRRPKLMEEFSRASAMLEWDTKFRMSKADQAYSDDLESLYAEVKAVIGEVAQQQAYNLVVLKTDERLTLDRSGEFVLNVTMRPVLYSDKAIDITPLVKARLEASKPPAPPAAPPAAPAAPPAAPPPGGPALPPPSGPGPR